MEEAQNSPVPYHNLSISGIADVWTTALTEEEREIITLNYQPLGFSSGSAARKAINSGDPSLIATVATHLKKDHIRDVGYKLLAIAARYASDTTELASLHFYLQAHAQFFYRWREIDGFALNSAVAAMRQQIALADHMEEHFRQMDGGDLIVGQYGYRQLCIIEERRGNYELAIALCERAKAQGWNEDWSKRIARLHRNLA